MNVFCWVGTKAQSVVLGAKVRCYRVQHTKGPRV